MVVHMTIKIYKVIERHWLKREEMRWEVIEAVTMWISGLAVAELVVHYVGLPTGVLPTGSVRLTRRRLARCGASTWRR
jgi:hypothetical protein